MHPRRRGARRSGRRRGGVAGLGGGRMSSHGRRGGAVLVLVAASLGLALAARAASGVVSADPWWFQDDYTSLTYVDPAGTTAAVDTAGTGTVSLPLRPAAVALDPAAAVGLIATAAGVQGWSFDGAAMVSSPRFDVGGTGYVGAAWLGAAGNLLAVATAGRLTLQAWNGSGWVAVASLALTGATSVAEGAPVAGGAASILVGTPTGFAVADYRGGALTLDPGAGIGGLQGVSGIASAPGGALVAAWHGSTLGVYGWDGSRYRETPTWEIPAGSQPILAVAWFRGGNGYWVLTADGSLTAYGFNGDFVVALPRLSTTLSQPVAALGTGWRQGQVAALVGSGWTYYDGAVIGPDPARSVGGLSLPLYQGSAELSSTVLSAGHAIDEIQVDAAVPQLPAGTGIAYQVSTDGGSTWTAVTPCVNPTNPLADCGPDNTAVPAGSEVAYRLLLSTSDPSVTPVVDSTDLYEIATETQARSGGMAVLIK